MRAMADLDRKTISTVVAGGSVGVGTLAVVAPRAMTAVFGLPGTGPFRFLVRLWGTRTATLGALALTVPAAQKRQVYAAVAVMDAVDAGLALSAGRDVTWRTKILAAVTSGTFAVAAAALAADVLP
jgi:hypothetical protein